MVVVAQCAIQLWDLSTCNVSFVIGLIYKYWNIKPTLDQRALSNIGMMIQCRNVELLMFGQPTLHQRWINKQNGVGPMLYCNFGR